MNILIVETKPQMMWPCSPPGPHFLPLFLPSVLWATLGFPCLFHAKFILTSEALHSLFPLSACSALTLCKALAMLGQLPDVLWHVSLTDSQSSHLLEIQRRYHTLKNFLKCIVLDFLQYVIFFYFLLNVLGWHRLTKSYRFQVHSSTTHYLYTELCVHSPQNSSLRPSQFILYNLLPTPAFTNCCLCSWIFLYSFFPFSFSPSNPHTQPHKCSHGHLSACSLWICLYFAC